VTESAPGDEDAGGTQFAAALATDAIETAFDGRWGIWLSYTGRWWAARHDGPNPGNPGTPGVLLVRADDPDQLKARIQEQELKICR
jgi:hypothetical protein